MDVAYCLREAVEAGASDLFIVAGAPVTYKVGHTLLHIGSKKVTAPDSAALVTELYELAERSMEHYNKTSDDDFSFAMPGVARFRVNTYRQRNSMAAVVRVVAFEIPNYKEMHIPDNVIELAKIENGMVLVTGVAGSGKSTTQACIIDRINKTRDCHIITLEDPIEYLHRNDKSIVSQREIEIDTNDYLSALRACLRQAPDVIFLGEMRDKETISTAMTAAETGHLVLATLHTNGAKNTIDRIIDSFPANQQAQIRIQLSSVLQTIVSQQLLPASSGGIVPAFEIMRVNDAIRNLIREAKTHQIDNTIASGAADGMVSMDQAIFTLFADGLIEKDVALSYASNPEQLKRLLANPSRRASTSGHASDILDNVPPSTKKKRLFG